MAYKRLHTWDYKIIKHVTTHWLSLGKSLDRTPLQWDALESYFLSEFEVNNETKDDDSFNREEHPLQQIISFVCAISNTSL